MQDRVTPIRSRRVIVVAGRGQAGEPAIETEDSTTLIGAETQNDVVVRRTYCSGCGAVLGEESVAAVCVSCGGLLCQACAGNRCEECRQSCCWTCSDSLFGRPERYCKSHFGIHFWAFMIQVVFLFGVLAGVWMGILHLVGVA